MFRKSSLIGIILVVSLGMISLWLPGCSGDNAGQPLAPGNAMMSQAGGQADGEQVQVNFAAQIKTVDQNSRQLTFLGRPDTVVALNNAEIVQLQAGVETQSQFGELVAGDSAHVYAYRYGNGYSYAYRICIVDPQASCEYDIAFRGTIETIDYAGAELTVEGRPEIIVVDDETEIWTVDPQGSGTTLTDDDPDTDPAQNRFRHKDNRHITLAITDLQVGDIIEVRADIVTVDTLLAAKIKLANYCEERCVSFESTIATIDYELMTLTFSDQEWTGFVCQNAILVSQDGDPLTLEDFVVNDTIAVKGFPQEDGTLRVCELTLLAP